MTMHVGDVVNIMKHGGGYWKGKITSVSDRHNDKIKYQQPIAIVEWGTNGVYAVIEKKLRREDGEFFEVRI